MLAMEGDGVQEPVAPVPQQDVAYSLAYGQPESFFRLVCGVSNGLVNGLKEKGVPEEQIGDWTSPRKTDAQLRMFGTFELRRGDVPKR